MIHEMHDETRKYYVVFPQLKIKSMLEICDKTKTIYISEPEGALTSDDMKFRREVTRI